MLPLNKRKPSINQKNTLDKTLHGVPGSDSLAAIRMTETDFKKNIASFWENVNWEREEKFRQDEREAQNKEGKTAMQIAMEEAQKKKRPKATNRSMPCAMRRPGRPPSGSRRCGTGPMSRRRGTPKTGKKIPPGRAEHGFRKVSKEEKTEKPGHTWNI